MREGISKKAPYYREWVLLMNKYGQKKIKTPSQKYKAYRDVIKAYDNRYHVPIMKCNLKAITIIRILEKEFGVTVHEDRNKKGVSHVKISHKSNKRLNHDFGKFQGKAVNFVQILQYVMNVLQRNGDLRGYFPYSDLEIKQLRQFVIAYESMKENAIQA